MWFCGGGNILSFLSFEVLDLRQTSVWINVTLYMQMELQTEVHTQLHVPAMFLFGERF